MGTITPRKRQNGTTGYTAQIRIKRDGQSFTEAKTFDRQAAAQAWLRKREAALDEPGAVLAARPSQDTLAGAIERYVSESLKEIGRTKAQVLRTIKTYSIADLPCNRVTSKDIVSFAHELSRNVQPQTVQNYLSHLGAVFAIARPAWGYELDQRAMQDALIVCKRLGTVTKSVSRSRRPTLDELDRLMQHFTELQVRVPNSTPMHKILPFALFSTRRQEEITTIRWADTEEDRVLVRDMKHPGQKQGNDIWCDLPEPARAVLRTIPKTDEVIFPYTTDAIGASFTRACKLLGINDLHFHDLRHEGVSRLFEIGLNIPHVAAVSGHRSWASLKRYTHLRQTGDKYKDWKWL